MSSSATQGGHKTEKKEETTAAKYNGLRYLAAINSYTTVVGLICQRTGQASGGRACASSAVVVSFKQIAEINRAMAD